MNKTIDISDTKYRAYASQIDKALRAFESTSEWADLIASLAKLNKVLIAHSKYAIIPKKILIGKRLAQCLHPALPNGVHLKALETYDLIFKSIGSDELAVDIFTYCSGLFPLLGYAAINVRPVLLQIYETHFLPLGTLLKPAMTGLIMGLLPGFENGSELHSRIYQLLESFCNCVEKSYFYCCLWECICVSANVRHAGLNYILVHYDKKMSVEDQIYLLGTNLDLLVQALCLSLEDTHPLVQRCVLDLLISCFPIHNCQLPKSDMMRVMMFAITLLLKRDMSLNRRLYAWLMGTDINGMPLAISNKLCLQQDKTLESKEMSYFDNHSKEIFTMAIKKILEGDFETKISKFTLLSLKIIISLLDRPELISRVLPDILLDILRCLYKECVTKLRLNVKKIIEEKLCFNSSNDEFFYNKMKHEEHIAIIEIYKTANILFAKFDPLFIWTYISELFESSCKFPSQTNITTKEFCDIVTFLLDKISIESYVEMQADHFLAFLKYMVNILVSQLDEMPNLDIICALDLILKMFCRTMKIFGVSECDTYRHDIRTAIYRQNEIRYVTNESENDSQFITKLSKQGPGNKVSDQVEFNDLCCDVDECQFPNHLGQAPDKYRSSVVSLIKDYLIFFHHVISKRIINNSSVEFPCIDYLFSYTNENASWESFCELVLNPSGVITDLDASDMVELLASACQLFEKCFTFGKYEITFDITEIPKWLRSLLVVCLATPFSLQYVSLNYLFNLVEFWQMSNNLTNFGASCIKILNETCFYKIAAFSVWKFILEDSSEVCLKAAEIFNRLHQNAPFSWLCENVVTRELLSLDQEKALKSFLRFTAFWNCLKDLNGKKSRQFEKSVLVLIDNLDNNNNYMLASLTELWIISRAKAGDLISILEPAIKILLHPDTARVSVQRNDSQKPRAVASYINDSCNSFHLVDTKIVSISNKDVYNVDNQKSIKKLSCEDYHFFLDAFIQERHSSIPKCSSIVANHSESKVTLHVNPFGTCSNGVINLETSNLQEIARHESSSETGIDEEIYVDFKPNFDSLDVKIRIISDILDEILYDVASKEDRCHTKNFKNFNDKETVVFLDANLKTESSKKKVQSLRSFILFYIKKYDFSRVLYANRLLNNFIITDSKTILNILLTSNMSYFTDKIESGTAMELFLRHKQSIMGQNFHQDLVFDATDNVNGNSYLELIVFGLLYFVRSFFSQDVTLNVGTIEIQRNKEVQISSFNVLRVMFAELTKLLQVDAKMIHCISNLLLKTKVQKTILYSLYSDLEVSPVEKCPYVQSSLRELYTNALLLLTTSLIQLEDFIHSVKEEQNDDLPKEFEQMNFMTDEILCLKTEIQFLSGHPIIYQPLFLEAIIYSLKSSDNAHVLTIWINFIQNLLPYFSKASFKILSNVILQLCLNMEKFEKYATMSRSCESVKLSSDYYICLMTSLTLMYHYSLFDHSSCGCKAYPGQAVDIGKMLQSFSGQLISGISNALSFQNRKFASQELPSLGSDKCLYLKMLDLLPSILKYFLNAWKFSENLDYLTSNKSSKMNFMWSNTAKQCILHFLNPLADNFMHSLLAAYTVIWNEKFVFKCYGQLIDGTSSNDQVVIVNILKEVKHISLNSLITSIRQMLRQPGIFSPVFQKCKFLSLEGGLLQMFYAFVKHLPDNVINESVTSIISFLRDCYQTNLDYSAIFVSICILTFILQKGSPIEEKREHKEVHDITTKLLESCSNIAGLSLEQAYFFKKYLAVKEDFVLELDSKGLEETQEKQQCQTTKSSTFSQSVQALHILAEVTSTLLDVVFQSDEKDKVIPLLNNILSCVFPYLRNHKSSNMSSFGASSKLIANLSSYQYTRRSWKRECFELLLESSFFQMDLKSLKCWVLITDNLMAHDKFSFLDLLARFGLAQTSSLNLFGSREAESEIKTQLLKRLSFTIFSSEMDQYQKYMPDIQEKLFDCLRSHNSLRLHAEVFSCFRVLVLRMSCYCLTSLWPTMITELIQVFVIMEQSLTVEPDEFLRTYKTAESVNSGCEKYNDLFLAASKLLDLFLALPTEILPHFQLYKWAFVVDLHTAQQPDLPSFVDSGHYFVPYALRIAKQMQLKFKAILPKTRVVNHLIIQTNKISSLLDLQEFFTSICKDSLERDEESMIYRSHQTAKSSSLDLHKMETLSHDATSICDITPVKIIESSILKDFMENST